MTDRTPREAAKYEACQIAGRSYYTSKDTRPLWYRQGFDKGWDAAIDWIEAELAMDDGNFRDVAEIIAGARARFVQARSSSGTEGVVMLITFRDREPAPQEVFVDGVKAGQVEYSDDGYVAYNREGTYLGWAGSKLGAARLLAPAVEISPGAGSDD